MLHNHYKLYGLLWNGEQEFICQCNTEARATVLSQCCLYYSDITTNFNPSLYYESMFCWNSFFIEVAFRKASLKDKVNGKAQNLYASLNAKFLFHIIKKPELLYLAMDIILYRSYNEKHLYRQRDNFAESFILISMGLVCQMDLYCSIKLDWQLVLCG